MVPLIINPITNPLQHPKGGFPHPPVSLFFKASDGEIPYFFRNNHQQEEPMDLAINIQLGRPFSGQEFCGEGIEKLDLA